MGFVIIGFVVGYLLVSVFLFGPPTSVLARKTDQSETAEVLAWIPILQGIPLIWAAGAKVWQVVLMTIGVIVAAALMGLAGGSMGDGGLGGTMASLSDWSIDAYFWGLSAWLGWRIAERRALPPVLGLTLALPLLNLPATWFFAFHDGWERPHLGGLAAGLVLSLALILPVTYVMHDVDDEAIEAWMVEYGEAVMAEQMAELEGMEAEGDLPADEAAAIRSATEPSEATAEDALASQQNDRTIRALFEVKGRFEKLDSLTEPENMKVHDHRMRALALVRNIRTDLQALQTDLDAATYEELANHLNRVEAEINFANDPSARRGGALTFHPKKPAASDNDSVPAAPAPMGDGAPTRPFAVQVEGECPTGTELRSRDGDKGDEEWCQQLAQYGGLRHGWYARYFEDGKPEQVGEYDQGLRVGTWTRFYPSGAVRAQAEFDAGLQHGWLLTFAESGERKKAVRFESGSAVR